MALCFRLVPGAAQYCLAAVAEGRLLVQWLAEVELRPAAPPCQLPLPSCGLLRAASIVRGSGTDEHVYLLLMQSYRISGFRLYPPCPAHPVGRVAPDGVFLPELCLTCLDVTRETVYLGTSEGLVMMVEHEHATLQWAGHVTCCRPRSLAPTPTPGAVWLPPARWLAPEVRTLASVIGTVSSPHDPNYEPPCRPWLRPEGLYVALASPSHLDLLRKLLLFGWFQRHNYRMVFGEFRMAPLLEQLSDFIDQGKLHVTVHSEREFTAEGLAAAVEELHSRRARGKIVLTFPQK
eukprot:EG_transcript_19022